MNDFGRQSCENPGGQILQDDSPNFRCNYDESESPYQNIPALHLLPNQKTLHRNRAEDAACFMNTGKHPPSLMQHFPSKKLSTAPLSSGCLDQYKAYHHLQAIPSNAQRKSLGSDHESLNIHGFTSKTIEGSLQSSVELASSSDIVVQPSYCPQNRSESACSVQHADGADKNLNDIVHSLVRREYFGPISPVNEQVNAISAQKDGPSTAGRLGQDFKEKSSSKSININSSVTGHAPKVEKLDEVDKLWDGYLRLNSSVKLPTVAYFKRGEKMPNINWSECIEVRGKVRLEAFEKYIQELPRSRTRELMVMHLRLKGGSSSKSGWVGIKEVSNKLIEGKRVGFSQLSPGVDLYVCPQSDYIISILAKHGYFKDTVAAKEKQDSLIGCVVWRKTSLDPHTKRVNEKNGDNPLSSSGFNSSSSSANPIDAIQPIRSAADDNLCTPSSRIESALSSLSYGLTPSVTTSTILVPLDRKQDAVPHGDLNTIHGIVKQLSEVEASIFKSLGLENCGQNLELLKAILPPPLNPLTLQQPPPTPNSEDELPEYDFNSAAARALATRPIVQANEAAKQNPQDERFRKVDRSSSVNQMCSVSQMSILPGRGPTSQKRKAQEHEHVWSNSSRKIGDNHSKSKFLFDDDDDMPEWNPSDTTAVKPSPPVGYSPGTARDQKLRNSSLPSRSDLPPLLPTPPRAPLRFPPKQLPSSSRIKGTSTGMMTSRSPPPRADGIAYVPVSHKYSSGVSSDRGSSTQSKPYSSKGYLHHKQ